jgi:excinuclease ABC subunit C
MASQETLYKNLPDTPGVYLMRDKKGTLLYVGKAGNLRRRVSSYFLRPHDRRIEQLVARIAKIDHQETDTAIEALILEAELIKKHEPPFNIREKDDKSFLYVEITKEPFPRVLLTRGRDLGKENYKVAKKYGPFTSASSLRAALKIIRRIFPYSTHPVAITPSSDRHSERSEESFPKENAVKILRKAPAEGEARQGRQDDKRGREVPTSKNRACFDYEIGLCPGTCIGAISKEHYRKNIRHIELFFTGKKERILNSLQKDMQTAAKHQDFERAESLKRRIFALKHIQDIAFLAEDKVADFSTSTSGPAHVLDPKLLSQLQTRIEGYDISNISGVSAVGSMVVFVDGKPDKAEYRKFKIKGLAEERPSGKLRWRRCWHDDRSFAAALCPLCPFRGNGTDFGSG